MVLPALPNPTIILEPGYLHPWFRRGSVNLIAGVSGSGKSRLLAQFMEALQANSTEWFGLPLQPVPFVYVATDRARSQIHEMWTKMEIKDWEKFPAVWAFNEDITTALAWQKEALKIVPDAKVFIVEHWTRFIGSAKNDAGRVSCYMTNMGRWADENGYTIIGVVEENKAKTNRDRYQDPRQRISGCAEWGHLSDTAFSLDKANPANPSDPHRVLYISDHNHNGKVIKLTFSPRGRLVPT